MNVTISKIITVMALSSFMLSCDGDPYSGIGSICTEDHPAVTQARSLSQEELAFLYEEIYRLRDKNSENHIEYERLNDTIPDNLKFLDAWKIRPNSYQPNIMLAGCMDEYIYLEFNEYDSEKAGITLSWAGKKERRVVESELLWTPQQ